MTSSSTRSAWPTAPALAPVLTLTLTLALCATSIGCQGGSLLPDGLHFPSSLSFPTDEASADAQSTPDSAPTPSQPRAETPTIWPGARSTPASSAEPVASKPLASKPLTSKPLTAQPSAAPLTAQPLAAQPFSGRGPTAYTWADLSARGRNALSVENYAAAESAFLSALAQTDAFESHDVRVKTSLLNLVHLTQALDSAEQYDQAEALIQVLIDQERAERRLDFDVAGPLMLSMAQRLLDQGDTVDAARMAHAALELNGASDPMNAQLRWQVEEIMWPVVPEAAAE
jgi:hypothetical protein